MNQNLLEQDTIFIHSRPNQNIESTLQQQTSTKFSIWFKIIIFCIIGIVMMSFKLFGIPTISVDCIIDRTHEALAEVNIALNNNHSLANGLIIVCSLFIDFFSVSTILYWFFKQNTLRMACVIFIFYIVRMPNLYIFTPKFPDGHYFAYPGFPSITVPYGRQSDFFFSGHCGILTITLAEWSKQNNFKMALVNVVALLYTAFLCVALRFHYIIDVTAGILIGHWSFLIIEKYEQKITEKGIKIQKWIYVQFMKIKGRKEVDDEQQSALRTTL